MTNKDAREFRDGYDLGYSDGYKKAWKAACEQFANKQSDDILSGLTDMFGELLKKFNVKRRFETVVWPISTEIQASQTYYKHVINVPNYEFYFSFIPKRPYFEVMSSEPQEREIK